MNVIVGLIEKNVIHTNDGRMINVDVSVKNVMYVKKIIFGNLLFSKYERFCDYVWWNYRVIRQRKKATCKTQKFYILFAFLLITLALLIAASIYCYLIKYLTKKKKNLLPFHSTNNELKQVLYW